MRKECEPPLRAGQPALIVTCGNTTRKYRVLDRDLLVLGRASACDVGLSCPGVAPVHCIIVRTSDGWRIRDCAGGRSPTRINGRAIHEETLRDTDVLQVGTFCFEVRLPPSNEVRERLDQLPRLKQELAASKSPSAPGNQLRTDAEAVTDVEALIGDAG